MYSSSHLLLIAINLLACIFFKRFVINNNSSMNLKQQITSPETNINTYKVHWGWIGGVNVMKSFETTISRTNNMNI